MTTRGRALHRLAQVLTSPASVPQLVARELMLANCFLIAAWAGVGTRVPELSFSLVWPAAGVATVWLLTSTARSLRWDCAALLSAACYVVLVNDGAWLTALIHPVATLLAALTLRAVVLRRVPGVAQPLEGQAVRHLHTFFWLAGGAVVACLLEAGFVHAALQMAGRDPEWSTVVLRWSRSWTAVFTVTSTALLALAALGRRVGTPEERRRRVVGLVRSSPRRLAVDVGGILLLTLLQVTASLVWFPEAPLSFALFIPAAWASVRFPPFAAASYAAVTGLATIAGTLAGRGPYAQVTPAEISALVVQSFFVVLFATVLTLAVISMRLRTAEQEAQSRAELLDRVLASSSDGIVLVDDAGRVVLRNRAAVRLLALPSIVTQGWALAQPRVGDLDLGRLRPTSGDPTPTLLPHERALDGTPVVHEDLLLPLGAGALARVLRLSAHPVPGGDQNQVLLTFSDVTAEHEQTNTLEAFAGEVAHDLKNPLSVVEGWSEVLEGELAGDDPPPPAQALPMVRRVRRAAGSMRLLIEELLSYTVARGTPLSMERLDLAEVVKEVVAARFATDVSDRPPLVEIDVEHDVLGDRLLVRQLLDNLVGNALKYVAPGTVPWLRITSRVEEDHVRVDVSDNGIGIPQEHRHRVFESLYRVERQGYSGTGLGLAICARVVERHQGVIEVLEGPDGVGTTLSFTLPGIEP